MGTTKPIRIGISVTPGDRTLLRKIQRQLRASHGQVTISGVYRIALHNMVQPLKSLADPRPAEEIR